MRAILSGISGCCVALINPIGFDDVVLPLPSSTFLDLLLLSCLSSSLNNLFHLTLPCMFTSLSSSRLLLFTQWFRNWMLLREAVLGLSGHGHLSSSTHSLLKTVHKSAVFPEHFPYGTLDSGKAAGRIWGEGVEEGVRQKIIYRKLMDENLWHYKEHVKVLVCQAAWQFLSSTF